MSRVPPFVLCGKTFTIDITGKLFNMFIFISVMLFGTIDFYHFIIKNDDDDDDDDNYKCDDPCSITNMVTH